jgi:Holliday junction resolvase RusA-like endonuclease
MIRLNIDCQPVSWSAAQKGKFGFFDKKSRDKEFARWQLKSQYRDEPIKGHVSLDFVFFMQIPKSTSKAMKRSMLNRVVLPTSPDVTNMVKLYEDCLQGIVIENDRFVSRVTASRYYSEKPGVEIGVRQWNEEIYRVYEQPKSVV